MSFRNLLAMLLLLLHTACTSPATGLQSLPSTIQGGYALGAGDEMRIAVQGFDTITNTYIVGDDGVISLPLVGPIQVASLTTSTLEQRIGQELVSKDLAVNPSVSVQLIKYRPFFILGEVQKPGQYPYVPGMSVLTAISIAGGHTFRADRKTYGISRTVGGVATKGKADETTPVQPGDTIVVYEAWF